MKIVTKKIMTVICVAMAATLGGCSKMIDDAYVNPNADTKVPLETLLPGIIGNFVGSSAAAGSAYGVANDGMYVGRYVQYWATNTTGNQYDQMGGATGASDVLGSVWAMHYFGMGQNLNKMIEWGTEDQQWGFVGVGYAIRAWSWLTLTNMQGEVIVTEAFNREQLTFKYDDQATVYDTVRAVAHRAIKFLDMAAGSSKGNLPQGDAYFYGGDTEKWKKFVYAVLARSYNQLSNKADYKPDSVIKYADLAMNVNADNAVVKFANTGITGTSNFYGPVRANVGTLRQTSYIANLLSGKNSRFPVFDPRTSYLVREDSLGNINGINPNKGTSGLSAKNLPFNFWGEGFGITAAGSDARARYIFKNGAPFPIITASEVKFMKGEALFRKGDKVGALDAYKQGIELSIDLLKTVYGQSVPQDKQITTDNTAAYLADVNVVPAAADLTLSHIMMQKYIALFGFGAIETWTDMRRFNYGSETYVGFVTPSGADLYINNKGKLVQRARPRYNSEYIYNIKELERLGGLDLDYHTKEQWFSKP